MNDETKAEIYLGLYILVAAIGVTINLIYIFNLLKLH